jgi:catechol 2,3-dioxygenase-like lactoylglutathione lyase family enzyme
LAFPYRNFTETFATVDGSTAEGKIMQQQISVITLGINMMAASRRFYTEGFGWAPVFESEEIIFYQMNGLMLGTWLRSAMAADTTQPVLGAGACTLGHNVQSEGDVAPTMHRLSDAGGTILRPADAPPHGGFRGYISDPDGHVWEIAYNPAWAIDAKGLVTFGL